MHYKEDPSFVLFVHKALRYNHISAAASRAPLTHLYVKQGPIMIGMISRFSSRLHPLQSLLKYAIIHIHIQHTHTTHACTCTTRMHTHTHTHTTRMHTHNTHAHQQKIRITHSSTHEHSCSNLYSLSNGMMITIM